MDDEKGYGKDTVNEPLKNNTEQNLDCGEDENVDGGGDAPTDTLGCGEPAEQPEEDLACCGDLNPPEDDVACCDDTKPSEVGCCGEAETTDDAGCGCGCGGEFPDQSLIPNPEQPEFIASTDFFEELERFAHLMGVVQVGYTQVIPSLVNGEEPPAYPNAIVLTYQMGEDIIEAPPGPEAQKLNDATYLKLGNITCALSDFIRAQGFATQVAHPYGGLLSFSPLGQKAGLGWIGQSGLLISPELGPRQKISAILTSIENLPIKKPEDHSWIPDYCDVCGKCIKACPEDAMVEKESCCGGKDIEFLEARCIGCSQGCTYCIEECPFDKKGYQQVKDKFDKMNAKLKGKSSRDN